LHEEHASNINPWYCAESVPVSGLQVLLLWWRVQYFARAFQNTRNTFLNTLVAVTRSVWPFLILLLLTLWGFAGAPSAMPAHQ
jgi:DNA-binding transcriptional regulator of glucitol operon